MVEQPTGSPRDAELEDDLAGALDRGEFFLVYQPTIDLETNAFAGVEALIRWRHPIRGVLGADAFIHLLEERDDIISVGHWAIHTACADGASWHDKGYRFNVSVNVAPRQFSFDGFYDDVSEALTATRFDASLFVLEFAQDTLTENDEATKARLARLRTLGVRFAIDDFDPSKGGLDDIKELTIDIVKLDRRFTAGVALSTETAALVRELIRMSETRHLQVIASGIEDLDQRVQLQSERVHVGQGYLFSKPHEATEIDRYLEDFAIFSGKPL